LFKRVWFDNPVKFVPSELAGEVYCRGVAANGQKLAYRFDAAILSRIRSEVTSRSNWAKDNKTLAQLLHKKVETANLKPTAPCAAFAQRSSS
jgi:hypothetical protein